METPLVYLQSDIPPGMTIREWRRERARRKAHLGLIRTLIRAVFPEAHT
jgi:hypothetical protein